MLRGQFEFMHCDWKKSATTVISLGGKLPNLLQNLLHLDATRLYNCNVLEDHAYLTNFTEVSDQPWSNNDEHPISSRHKISTFCVSVATGWYASVRWISNLDEDEKKAHL